MAWAVTKARCKPQPGGNRTGLRRFSLKRWSVLPFEFTPGREGPHAPQPRERSCPPQGGQTERSSALFGGFLGQLQGSQVPPAQFVPASRSDPTDSASGPARPTHAPLHELLQRGQARAAPGIISAWLLSVRCKLGAARGAFAQSVRPLQVFVRAGRSVC
eukprot:scaffold1582_cov363-Prasinococcus_capsulatus_cf.AAC.5